MHTSDSANKTARYLFWVYCLFIIYGCFIPFRFNFDPNFVRWRWATFLAESLHERTARVSLTDIVSNILLYLPFGILSVWARISTDRKTILPVAYASIYGLLFGIVIECGQTLIGVGNGFRRPRPPNRACGSPAHGSPVGGFLIGIGSPASRL